MSFPIIGYARPKFGFYNSQTYYSQVLKHVRTNFHLETYPFAYSQLPKRKFLHISSNPTPKMDPIIEGYLREQAMEIKDKPKDKMLSFEEYVDKYIGTLEEYAQRESIQRLYKNDWESIKLSYEGYCWGKYNAYKGMYENGNPATMI